ncbi:MAG: hypothetical protein HC844_21445 [Tabrizicola sp.]|nr:hypothetical protein [Tabrizicola sp.]
MADRLARQPPGRTGKVASVQSALRPQEADTWTIALYGQSQSEVAVIGEGATNLDLTVADEAGQPVCADLSASDIALCAFAPARNGYFTVTVRNAGTLPGRYTLLTD